MFINRNMADEKYTNKKDIKPNNSDQKTTNNKVARSTAGRWTNLEHQKFTEALKIHGKNWKKVEDYIGTRTGAQVRSHAQKFFLKVQKKLNVDKKNVIENLDNAEIEYDDGMAIDTKFEESDENSLNKRNYNEFEVNDGLETTLKLDRNVSLGQKEMMIFTKDNPPVKDYFEPEEKMHSYMPSFHKESFEIDYDSKYYGASRNSRTSRNNDLLDLEDKVFRSYFKDRDVSEISDRFRFSKNSEREDMDEKLHGLFKHKESFDTENKDFKQLDKSRLSENPLGAPLVKVCLDEGILNLKLAATDLNNNILRLEQLHKTFIGDQPAQLMDLPMNDNYPSINNQQELSIHNFQRKIPIREDSNLLCLPYDDDTIPSHKKSGRAFSEDHILVSNPPRLHEIVQFHNNENRQKSPNVIEMKLERRPSFKLLDDDSDKIDRLEKLKCQSNAYKIAINGDTVINLTNNDTDNIKRTRLKSYCI